MPLLNGVNANDDTISVYQTFKDAQGNDLQYRETMYGKTNPNYHVVATEQVGGNGYRTVQIVGNTLTGNQVLKTATDNPDSPDYYTEILGYSGANGNISGLADACRTQLFTTVVTVV